MHTWTSSLSIWGQFYCPRGICSRYLTERRKKWFKNWALNYEITDYCPSGCILYTKEMESLSHYPKCRTSRFIPGSKTIFVCVMRYFPVLPKLLCIFKSAKIAKLLQYHSNHLNLERDEVMKSIADNLAWWHVDEEIDPSFFQEKRIWDSSLLLMVLIHFGTTTLNIPPS